MRFNPLNVIETLFIYLLICVQGSHLKLLPLPILRTQYISLPIPPISRSPSQDCTTRSSSRLPRKILAASQIFANAEQLDGSTSMSAFVTVDAPGVDKTLPALPSDYWRF